jgi:hypothetical protein
VATPDLSFLDKNANLVESMKKNRIPGLPPVKIKNTPRGQGRTCKSSADFVRRFLTHKGAAGLDEKGRTRWVRMLDNMVYLASSKTSPQAVAAFNALADRAWGKAKSHDDDLDAIAKQGGIQIVYVAPTELDADVRAAKAALPPKPDFIEGQGELQDNG